MRVVGGGCGWRVMGGRGRGWRLGPSPGGPSPRTTGTRATAWPCRHGYTRGNPTGHGHPSRTPCQLTGRQRPVNGQRQPPVGVAHVGPLHDVGSTPPDGRPARNHHLARARTAGRRLHRFALRAALAPWRTRRRLRPSFVSPLGFRSRRFAMAPRRLASTAKGSIAASITPAARFTSPPSADGFRTP